MPSLPPLDLGVIGEDKPEAKSVAPEPKPGDPVRAAMKSSTDSVKAGEPFELIISVRIAYGYHIYGLDAMVPPFVPTGIKLTLPQGIEANGEWVVPTPRKDKAGDAIYTESVLFRRALKARPEAVGKFSVNTTRVPGSPSFSHGYVTALSRSRRSHVMPAIDGIARRISSNTSLTC